MYVYIYTNIYRNPVLPCTPRASSSLCLCAGSVCVSGAWPWLTSSSLRSGTRVCKANLQSLPGWPENKGQRVQHGTTGFRIWSLKGKEVPRRGQRCPRHSVRPFQWVTERRASRQGHKTTHMKTQDGKEWATLLTGLCVFLPLPFCHLWSPAFKCSTEQRLHPS